MTLAAVWVETKGTSEALCLASDSRTTPGPIDGVSKLSLFRREDIAGVWAGDLRYASVALQHLDAMFSATASMLRRDVDVRLAFVRAQRSVVNRLNEVMTPNVPTFLANADAITPSPTSIVLGGYSIDDHVFQVFRLDWHPERPRWSCRLQAINRAYPIYLSDRREIRHGARETAKALRREAAPPRTGWRMEPLRAVHLTCLDAGVDTVGGDIQLVKVFRHGSTRTFGFVGPRTAQGVSVLGTRLGARVRRELASSGLLIDESSWRADSATYQGLSGSRR